MAIELAPAVMYYADFIRWLEKRVDGFEQPRYTMKDRDGVHKEYYVSIVARMRWLVHDYPDEWVAFVAARRLAGDNHIGK